MEATKATKTTCSPATFRAQITAPGSKIHSMKSGQHDARQLLLFIITKLREDLPKPIIDDQEIIQLLCNNDKDLLQEPIQAWVITKIWAPIKNSPKRLPRTQEALINAFINNMQREYATDSGLQRSKACIEKNAGVFNNVSDALIALAKANGDKRMEGINLLLKNLFNALGAEKFFLLCNEISIIKKNQELLLKNKAL